MSDAVAWILTAAGLAVTFRAARARCGTAPAALAMGALFLGQLLTFPLAVADAALFALAAIAIERGLALHTAGRPWALALVALPALAPLLHGVSLPTASKMMDLLFCSQHGIASTSAVVW